MRYFALAFLLALLVLAWQLHSGRIAIPPQWNPWAQLEVAAAPNWLTRYKLQRLNGDPVLCRTVLEQTGLRQAALPDRDLGKGCGWKNAVRVSDERFAPAFTLSCTAAVSLAMWERHTLQPAAQAHFGQPLARVEHLGSYACRNVRGGAGEGGRRSQHASANAFDAAAFRLENGRRIRILGHWRGSGAEAAFLRDARDGACRFFNGTLSPDYNQAHQDHFHLDWGGYRMCR